MKNHRQLATFREITFCATYRVEVKWYIEHGGAMEVEYTLCQIQLGDNSLAAKTHRRQGGDPRVTINVGAYNVQWVLENLFDGEPEIVDGVPRRNRVDFYFLLDVLRRDRGQLPQPVGLPNPALRLQPTNSVGTERPGGRPVRMETPNRRYRVASVEAFATQAPAFHAIAQQPIFLHLDIETTPPRMYGQIMEEAHFGIQASFEIVDPVVAGQSQVIITMSHETYATIYEDLQNL